MGLEPVPTGAAQVLQELIVEGEAADEYSDVGARQIVGGNSRVFQRLPGGVQQEALLRIQRVRLAWGHPEELGIELIYRTEESTSPGDDLADLRRIGIVISRGVPTCFGHVAGGVGFAAQQAPQAVRGIGTAREAASDSDDGQRLVAAVFSEPGHLLPSSMEFPDVGRAARGTPRQLA